MSLWFDETRLKKLKSNIMKTNKWNEGDKVQIGKGGNAQDGEILTRFIQQTTIEVDGKTLEADATAEKPAFLVKLADDKHVIKFAEEFEI